ncbi:OmpP1/FadL family transporter [Ensifer soli]|uniref:OmpP1/FadL family transporter n=1 Tax=Ciceribacter sp. sgz301302 TaxID=3342379 RepID=UPI0035B71BF5
MAWKKRGLGLAIAMATIAGEAQAGGLERSGYNIDLLFDPADYVFEAATDAVMPRRRLKDVVDTDPSDGLGSDGIGGGATRADDTESYFSPRIGFKAAIGPDVDCMADYSQPWGAHLDPGRDWVGANSNIETKIVSDAYALTCSYGVDVGQGVLKLIGGGSYQTIDGYKEQFVAPVPGGGVGRIDLSGSGWGWRAGIAYEIPDYAFRASLVYNNEIDLGEMTGEIDLTQIPKALNPANPTLGVVSPIYGTATIPSALEFKLQTGIAPDWLVFGSVKWTDWSVIQSLPFCPVATKGLAACVPGSPAVATSFDLLYRDGWEIGGGIGHRFNDQWAGAVGVTWDRGTSTGVGTSSDTWTLTSGVSYKPTPKLEVVFAGTLGLLTSGSSSSKVQDGITYGDDISYRYGTDVVGALSTSLKVRF